MDIIDVLELFHVRIRALQWAVYRVVGKQQEKGLVVMSIDEVDRLPR